MGKQMTAEELLQKYQRKFEELDLELLECEELKHCLDPNKYYFPQWAISNMGRCYSLAQNKWIRPTARGNNRNYWSWKGDTNIASHLIVTHYFLDKSDMAAIQKYGAKGVTVHHDIPIEIPEELKHGTEENAEARIKHCMKFNCKANLHVQQKDDHVDDHSLMEGRKTKAERKGTAVWTQEADVERTILANSGTIAGNQTTAHIEYRKDENNEIIRVQQLSVKFGR